jgi:hypothetical protein
MEEIPVLIICARSAGATLALHLCKLGIKINIHLTPPGHSKHPASLDLQLASHGSLRYWSWPESYRSNEDRILLGLDPLSPGDRRQLKLGLFKFANDSSEVGAFDVEWAKDEPCHNE